MTDLEIPIGKRTKMYRFLEMLPALLSWVLLLTPVILAIISPLVAAYFILIFMAQYLLKAGIMAGRVFVGYREMRHRQAYDWHTLINDLDNPEDSLKRLQNEEPNKEKLWHYNNLHDYIESDQERITSNQLYHLVVVAIYNESIDVLRPTIQSLADSNYDLSKVMVYVAYEERGSEATRKIVETIKKEFGDKFFVFKNVCHPDKLPGEVIGKGGNITYAGREFYKFMQQQQMNPDHILVTTLDTDNRVHKNFLASVAYAFITTPNRKHYSYQPIPMYLNNIWDTSAPARMIATGSSFWWAIQSTRPHQLQNFSSHSQPMAALIDTDFWSTRTIVEDGHQFWRTYFAFDGKHDVIPTFVPIFQDAVLSSTYRSTLRAQFVQLQRWAYGASDIPYVAVKGFFTKNNVPKVDVFLKWLRLTESHVSRATSPLILAGAAWAPILANPEGRDSIIAHQLPGIAAILQTVALFGVSMMIYLTFQILPKRPKHYSFGRNILMLIQWVLLPPLSIIYGSLTALDSQTRLLMGRYLDRFVVTEKAVKE